MTILALKEANMVRGIYFACLRVVQAVGLGIFIVTNEDTFEGATIELRIMFVLN